MYRIQRFSERKKAVKNGAKANGPDLPLSEAVWLSEADLNFEKADASVLIETLKLDSFFTTVPVQSDGAGNYVVKESDLIIAQSSLEAQFGRMDQLKFVDVSLKDLGSDRALFRALAFKQEGVPELAPLPTGCFSIQDADDIMNMYMARLNAEPQGTIFVSISSQTNGLNTTNVNGLLNGYHTYLGSDETFGLTEYLASGPASAQFCFPDYWQKHLAMKQWYFDQFTFQPGRRLIQEVYYDYYNPTTGSPMSYGSPYYPMGPYDHVYEFKRALAICCVNNPGNSQ